MTFSLATMGHPKTAGVSTISAANYNYVAISLNQCIDPINGGTFTGTGGQVIIDGNQGWKFDYSAGPGLEIAGVVGCSVVAGSLVTVKAGAFLTLAATSTTTFTATSILTGSTKATLTFENLSILTFASGANIIYALGSATTLDGDVDLGGAMVVSSGGAIGVANGGEIFLDNGGLFTVQNGGLLTVDVGGDIVVDGEITIAGTLAVGAGGTVTLGGTVTPTHSARTFTRTAPQVPWFDTASWTEGIFAAPVNGYYTSTSIAGATNDRLVFPIDVPDGATITAVSVWTDPAGGHGGEPAVKTTLELYEQNVATGAAITQVFTLQDATTVGGGTYEPAHAVTQSGLTTVVDKSTKTYFVVIIPENGANAVVGTQIWPPRITFTRVKLGEE